MSFPMEGNTFPSEKGEDTGNSIVLEAGHTNHLITNALQQYSRPLILTSCISLHKPTI